MIGSIILRGPPADFKGAPRAPSVKRDSEHAHAVWYSYCMEYEELRHGRHHSGKMSSSAFPQTDSGSTQTERDKPPSSYLKSKPLPFELREHCIIYFEEQLYHHALTLLTQLVTSVTPFLGSSGSCAPVFVPPPQHLSLAATLIVHPTLTSSRAPSDRVQASNAALKLLYSVNRLVGPINADFSSAFTFLSLRDRRGFSGSRRRRETEDKAEDDRPIDQINSELASTGSLWTRAEDFWHAAGWALNCSVAYPKRWARWKLWLNLMLDVLESDWQERARLDREADKSEQSRSPDGDDATTPQANSLIIKYLPSLGGAHGGFRRAVRAVFADGSAKAQQEFRQIFEGEVKQHKDGPVERKDNRKPRMANVNVNVDEGIYADYLDDPLDDNDDEDDEDDIHGARQDNGATTSISPWSRRKDSFEHGDEGAGDIPNGAVAFGGIEAMALRLRLLALLSSVSYYLPEYLTTIDSLYDTYQDHLRALPLFTFSLFFCPTMLPHFPLAACSSLTQLLLRSFISSSAPLPYQVQRSSTAQRQRQSTSRSTVSTSKNKDVQPSSSPPSSYDDDLTQEVLEKCYLPFAANTTSLVDNAKVSLLVEALLRLYAHDAGLPLDVTPALRRAVDQGIQAREAKATRDRRKKPGGRMDEEETSAKAYLKGSAARLRSLLEACQKE